MFGPPAVPRPAEAGSRLRVGSLTNVDPARLVVTPLGRAVAASLGLPLRDRAPVAAASVFAPPATGAVERLRAFSQSPLPPGFDTPLVRKALAPLVSLMEVATDPLPAEWQFQLRALLSLGLLLKKQFEWVTEEYEQAQKRHDHLKGNRRAAARRAADEATRASVSEWQQAFGCMLEYVRLALPYALMAAAHALRRLGAPENAALVADCLRHAGILEAADAGRPVMTLDRYQLLIRVGRIVEDPLNQLYQPPVWPAAPAASRGEGRNAAVTRYGERIAWVVTTLFGLFDWVDASPLCAQREWLRESMASVQKVLTELANDDRQGRPAPQHLLLAARQARRSCDAIAPAVRSTPEAEREVRQAFNAWRVAILPLSRWVAASRGDHPDFGKAVETRRQATPPSEAAGTAAQAEPAPERDPADPQPVGFAGVSTTIDPPDAGPGPVPGAPRIHRTPPAARAPRPVPVAPAPPVPLRQAVETLLATAPGSAADARNLLLDFIEDRRLRTAMAQVPPEQSGAVLARLAFLVACCDTGSAPLNFFLQQELLDAAWTARDAEAGKVLSAAVLAHFAGGPGADESAAPFRSACLRGFIEKICRALSFVEPPVARAALQALERRLELQDAEDTRLLAPGRWPLAGELQAAVAFRRLSYMAQYPGLSAQERQAGAEDMRAWLASLLFALAAHADDGRVVALAGRLAKLGGLGHTLPAQIDPQTLGRAAVDMVTGGQSASCSLRPRQRHAHINAHHLDTRLFRAVLAHLAASRTEAGTPAFFKFDLLVGQDHDDGAPPGWRKAAAVDEFLESLPPSWRRQNDGGPIVYLHDGRHGRDRWGTRERSVAAS